MKKYAFIGVLALCIVAGTVVWLRAAPALGPVAADPAYIVVNTPTVVLFTAHISDSSVIPTSVNLFRTDASGKPIASIATLRDDGTNGDSAARDGIFSTRAILQTVAYDHQYFVVSAAFRGVLKRVTSAVTIIPTWNRINTLRGQVDLEIPSAWVVRSSGDQFIELASSENRPALSSQALATDESITIERLEGVNPLGSHPALWFAVHFQGGFSTDPTEVIRSVIADHEAIAVTSFEIGRRRHIYVGIRSDILHIHYSLQNQTAIETYERVLGSIRLD